MSTIVIFGSAARFAASRYTARQPRDIDVAHAGCTPEEAVRAATAWAESHGLGGLPVDAHELERGYSPEGQPPVYRLRAIDTLDADTKYVLDFEEGSSLQRRIPSGFTTAVRVFAETGEWPYCGSGWGLTLDADPDSYFGDGLDALRNALDRCTPEQRSRIDHMSGRLVSHLVDADPRVIAVGRRNIARGLQAGSGGSGFRVVMERYPAEPWRDCLVVPTYAGRVVVGTAEHVPGVGMCETMQLLR